MKKKRIYQKGFTLTEIIIVILIVVILVMEGLITINPIKKINAAKDSGVKSNVEQLVSALQAYRTNPNNSATFPDSLVKLVDNGEIKSIPKQEAGAYPCTTDENSTTGQNYCYATNTKPYTPINSATTYAPGTVAAVWGTTYGDTDTTTPTRAYYWCWDSIANSYKSLTQSPTTTPSSDDPVCPITASSIEPTQAPTATPTQSILDVLSQTPTPTQAAPGEATQTPTPTSSGLPPSIPTLTSTPTPTPTCSTYTSCATCIANSPYTCGWNGSACQAGTSDCPGTGTPWYWWSCLSDSCPTPTPTPTVTPFPTATPTMAPTRTPTPTAAPIPTSTPTPTPVPCSVTTSPSSLSLVTGGTTGTVTAVVSSGQGTATITQMRFGSYDTSLATVSPTSDSTSPYSTTVTTVAAGSTAVWATADLSDGRTCQERRTLTLLLLLPQL